MSMLPACSRGGMVRRAWAAMCGSAGTADAARGGRTKPPRSSRACSRAAVAASELVAGGQPDRAHERGAGDPHAREVRRGRPPVGEVPVDLERLRELVAEEPEARYLGRVAVTVSLDVDDLDVEEVSGLSSLDVHRAGERVQADPGPPWRPRPAMCRGRTGRRTRRGSRGRPRRRARTRWPAGCPGASGCARWPGRRPAPCCGRCGSRWGAVGHGGMRSPRLDSSCWPPSMS